MQYQHGQSDQHETDWEHPIHQFEVDGIGDVVQHWSQPGDGDGLPIIDRGELVHGRHRGVVDPMAELAVRGVRLLVDQQLGVDDERLVIPEDAIWVLLRSSLGIRTRGDGGIRHVEPEAHDDHAGVPYPVRVGVPDEVREQGLGVLDEAVDPLLGA